MNTERKQQGTLGAYLGERLEFDPLLIHKISAVVGALVGLVLGRYIIENTPEEEEDDGESPDAS